MSIFALFAAAASATAVPLPPAPDAVGVSPGVELAVTENEKGPEDYALPPLWSEYDDDGSEGAQLRLKMLRLKLKVPI